MLNRKTETKYLAGWITCGALPNGVTGGSPQFENAVQFLGVHDTSGAPGAPNQYWSLALPAQLQAGQTVGGVTISASNHNRIGDRIEPQSHRVKMTLRIPKSAILASESPSFEGASPYTYVAQQTPVDITAYVFYGYVKSLKTYQGSGANGYIGSSVVVNGQNEATRAMQYLLDNGDGTFQTFSGSPATAQLPLSEYVNMKVKKVHLRQGAGWINSSAGLVSPLEPFPNADSQNTISKQITLKYKPPSKLIYKSSTDIYPENYAPVFAVAYVYNDATASTNQTTPGYGAGVLEYIAQAQVWFKDHQ